MQRLLICCCLLAATVRGMKAFAQDNRDHEMVRVREDNDQDYQYDLQPSAVDMRIFGGQPKTNAELGGYIVALSYNKLLKCGGTLIKDDIVLTAAHCFVDRPDMENWVVDGGLSTLTQLQERRIIQAFTMHSKYKKSTRDWDVAIILLDKPMVGKNIHTVSLCSTKLAAGTQLDVSGWGKLTNESKYYEIHLRSAKVPIIDWTICKKAYKKDRTVITKRMICAADPGKKDACTLDSGGPLVYNKEVCGIVSFGVGCGRKDFPGVYADVYVLKRYIEDAIENLRKI